MQRWFISDLVVLWNQFQFLYYFLNRNLQNGRSWYEETLKMVLECIQKFNYTNTSAATFLWWHFLCFKTVHLLRYWNSWWCSSHQMDKPQRPRTCMMQQFTMTKQWNQMKRCKVMYTMILWSRTIHLRKKNKLNQNSNAVDNTIMLNFWAWDWELSTDSGKNSKI